ncbi:hypothetical protein AVEN_8557-1 [Araneus ventricosus]|uniref:Uncharacterized protein n=1 Tax=Araneus ventricosus TaxID=182803 RepID=A0A4Y2GPS1_ARAVE|nr:hypothetical protein AVEN_8557-1 [Araneus ventricosus]
MDLRLDSIGKTAVYENFVLSYRQEKNPDTRHAGGGRYGNGIFHCILGVKEKAFFHLAQMQPAKVSFRFVLLSKSNSSPNEGFSRGGRTVHVKSVWSKVNSLMRRGSLVRRELGWVLPLPCDYLPHGDTTSS